MSCEFWTLKVAPHPHDRSYIQSELIIRFCSLIFSYSGLTLQQTQPYLDLDNCSYRCALKKAFPSSACLLDQQWTHLIRRSRDDLSALERWWLAVSDSTIYLNKVEILEFTDACRESCWSKETDLYRPLMQNLLTRCNSLKKLVWDLDKFALLDEYKIAIEHHGILEELAIIADGPGECLSSSKKTIHRNNAEHHSTVNVQEPLVNLTMIDARHLSVEN